MRVLRWHAEKMPNLAVGDKITFTFETEPVGGVQLTNRLVNWEGGSKFGVIDEQITLQKSGDGWVYTVPTSLGEMLSSTISYPFYHAVTLEYTDASHIQHKATAVYTSRATVRTRTRTAILPQRITTTIR